MKWLHRKHLKKLLLTTAQYNNSQIVQVCYRAMIQQNLLSYMGSQNAPTRNILEIYERRSKIENSPARGFEQLLAALEATKDAYVRIHSFMVDGEDFVVFTNTTTTKLHGILIVDVRRQMELGWFNKEGKWRRRPGKIGTGIPGTSLKTGDLSSPHPK